MSSFVEIMIIAAAAQLAVLPGEKVQFLIAGLSTRYHPVIVVSAAGTAFAGWTALEIAFGNALIGLFPPVVLDLFTAGLFLVFAVLLFRSVPEAGSHDLETDGSGIAAVEEYQLPVVGEVPGALGQWLPIFGMMAAGEFGDKTQLITISLAVQYGATSAIWFGEMFVIIPISIANALFFYRFSHRFDARKAHFLGAAIFAFFGLDTLLAVTTGVSVWETVVGVVATALGSLL